MLERHQSELIDAVCAKLQEIGEVPKYEDILVPGQQDVNIQSAIDGMSNKIDGSACEALYFTLECSKWLLGAEDGESVFVEILGEDNLARANSYHPRDAVAKKRGLLEGLFGTAKSLISSTGSIG
jgi:hypothetical protein